MPTKSAPPFTLELQCEAHAAEMFLVLSDPAIYTFENAPPVSEQWLRERFRKLESRRSGDGSEHWLNWVVRLPTGELAGYVQATVNHGEKDAFVAYVFASRYWGMGLASAAVREMLSDVVRSHGTSHFLAVFKRANARSQRLLERLGFAFATPEQVLKIGVEADEKLMVLSTLGS